MRISRAKWYKRIGYTPRIGQAMLEKAAYAGHRYLSFFGYPRSGKSYGAAHFISPLLLEPDRHLRLGNINGILGPAGTGDPTRGHATDMRRILVECGHRRLAKPLHQRVDGFANPDLNAAVRHPVVRIRTGAATIESLPQTR